MKKGTGFYILGLIIMTSSAAYNAYAAGEPTSGGGTVDIMILGQGPCGPMTAEGLGNHFSSFGVPTDGIDWNPEKNDSAYDRGERWDNVTVVTVIAGVTGYDNPIPTPDRRFGFTDIHIEPLVAATLGHAVSLSFTFDFRNAQKFMQGVRTRKLMIVTNTSDETSNKIILLTDRMRPPPKRILDSVNEQLSKLEKYTAARSALGQNACGPNGEKLWHDKQGAFDPVTGKRTPSRKIRIYTGPGEPVDLDEQGESESKRVSAPQDTGSKDWTDQTQEFWDWLGNQLPISTDDLKDL